MKKFPFLRSKATRLYLAFLALGLLFFVVTLPFGTVSDSLGWTFIGLFVLAFVCELIDSSFGMGYGTILVPVLIFMGFEPRDAVPTILLSELFTGFASSVGHHLVGNVDFHVRSRSWNVAVALSAVALVTSPIAAFLVANISSDSIVTAIGYLIVAEGLAIIALHSTTVTFSWFRLFVLGAFASFTKALSGGGYGPLVTGGQVLIGEKERHAVAITSFSETLTCLVALVAFFWGGGAFNMQLLWPVLLGALISVPLSLRIVHEMRVTTFRSALGVVTALIGLMLLFL